MAEFMLSIVVKSTILLLAAGLIDWMLQRQSAATRHLVWTAALAGLLALPLMGLALPPWGPAWSHPSVTVYSRELPNPAAGSSWLAMRAPEGSAADEAPSAPKGLMASPIGGTRFTRPTLPVAPRPLVQRAAVEAQPADSQFTLPHAARMLGIIWAGGALMGALLLLAGGCSAAANLPRRRACRIGTGASPGCGACSIGPRAACAAARCQPADRAIDVRLAPAGRVAPAFSPRLVRRAAASGLGPRAGTCPAP